MANSLFKIRGLSFAYGRSRRGFGGKTDVSGVGSQVVVDGEPRAVAGGDSRVAAGSDRQPAASKPLDPVGTLPSGGAGGFKRIFDGLDLDLHEGMITTLIGANGCGKTTLFNLLTKNLTPQSGRIELCGEDVSKLRLDEFARMVAIVHQHNRAPADLAVKKLVGYGRFPHRRRGRSSLTDEDERMIDWALETTALQGLADHPVSALSGGQMQRVWVAMALAQGTKVLLLDEPTTFLDIRYQLELLEMLRRLSRQTGMTIIMVLHDINQAIQFSDEVVALTDGEAIAQGCPCEVITSDLLERIYGIGLEVVEVHGQPYVLTAQIAQV